MGSFWGHFGDDVGSTLGSLWAHFGVTLDRNSKHVLGFGFSFFFASSRLAGNREAKSIDEITEGIAAYRFS